MTTQIDEEVKEPTEEVSDDVLTIEDLEDPESDDLPENSIVEDPENAPADEKDTQAIDSSIAEKPADDEQVEEPEGDGQEVLEAEVPAGDESGSEVDVENQPKPVPGETPREKALRLEVERVKALNRKLKGEKLFVDVPETKPSPELDDQDRAVLESVDPEELSSLEKVIDVIAKKKGWVKKDELSQQTYEQTAQAELSAFMKTSPEFSEEKDPDGVLWDQFKKEFNRYKKPEDPHDYKEIFQKIKKDVIGVTTDTTDLKKVEAAKEKIKVSSHASGAAPTAQTKTRTVDPELAQLINSGAMKGFDDEELSEIGLK